MRKFFYILFLLTTVGFSAYSQSAIEVRYTIVNGDTIPIVDLVVVNIGGVQNETQPKFRNRRQSWKYRKLTAYVKKVYPYAQLASEKLKECEQEINANPESRKRAMKKVEKALRKKYGSALKGLTVTQGKLLLLLIERETGHTPFELVKELRGSFSAGLYQGVALLFGSNLKSDYQPRGKHWMIEDIVKKIENGTI